MNKFSPQLNIIVTLSILLYDITREVEMDFFREHKKIIVGLITVSFIIWTVGMGLLILLPSMGK